jgi:phospholipid-binding lipoprotein MlaA
MSNTQFLVAVGICISLSSTMVAAETKNARPVSDESSTVSQDTTIQNNDTTTSFTGDARPTLMQRSVDKMGEIGSRSIEIGNRSLEEVSALGSKIAVNANASQPNSVKDPFEHLNRKIFKFNMKVDQYVLLPVARTYKKVVPDPVRHGVTNFFVNLSMPWTAVNNLLQGHPGTSVESLSRFVINTATTLGFYDTATYLGIERSDQDFGLTLGLWGIGSGPYVMLPLLGPSTVRDTFARAVDQFGVPQNYLNNTWESVGLTGLKLVDIRSRIIGFESFVQGDQYTLLRDIYLQKRQFQSGAPSAPAVENNTNDGFNNDGFNNNDFGNNGFGDDKSKIQSSNTATTPSEQIAQDNVSTIPALPDVEVSMTALNINASAANPMSSEQF